jgi:hypothetical protein
MQMVEALHAALGMAGEWLWVRQTLMRQRHRGIFKKLMKKANRYRSLIAARMLLGLRWFQQALVLLQQLTPAAKEAVPDSTARWLKTDWLCRNVPAAPAPLDQLNEGVVKGLLGGEGACSRLASASATSHPKCYSLCQSTLDGGRLHTSPGRPFAESGLLVQMKPAGSQLNFHG